MSRIVTRLKLFVASPNDVSVERKIVRKIIEEINEYYTGLDYELEFSGWENCPPGMGRAQSIINRLITDCDIFLGIMGKSSAINRDCQLRNRRGISLCV